MLKLEGIAFAAIINRESMKLQGCSLQPLLQNQHILCCVPSRALITSWFTLGSLSGWRIKVFRIEDKLVEDPQFYDSVYFCSLLPSQYFNSVVSLRKAVYMAYISVLAFPKALAVFF